MYKRQVGCVWLSFWFQGVVSRTILTNSDITVLRGKMRRQEGLALWFEMLTQAVSIDINLNTEQKFNLLNGEIGLDPAYIVDHGHQDFATDVLRGDRITRVSWRYRRYGRVGASSPWTYTAPRIGAGTDQWPISADTLITLNTTTSIGANWIEWLGS